MIDLFKIDFITITLLDVVDIILVAYLFYIIFNNMRGTIASQIFAGLVTLLFMSFLAQAFNMKALGFLLKLITDIWVIAFVILFQPELRRLLIILSRNRFLRFFIRSDVQQIADEIVSAVVELSQKQHGALIVLTRTTGLRGVIETGIQMGSKVSKSLLQSIFYPRSALHDGAVIIRNNLIEAARCTLPLTAQNIIDGFQLGMRHKAGIGITEQADVISIIVSEETGIISVAENGKLTRGFSNESLKARLNDAFSPKAVKFMKAAFKNLENE